MSTNSKYEVEKTWQLIEPSSGFKGVRIEKRGDQYRIPGSCLVNFDFVRDGIREVLKLPADVPCPKYATPTVGLANFSNGVRYSYAMWIADDRRLIIATNSGGKANFYFPDIVWYADECA
ncbi:hypothetical protein [Varibaculum cambriense]|uniref:hypothetical protein n=1 Tax=Varibaculum cambriense TaxID=184870 RepID=UPI00241CFADC|nr:hypothetical protein [Varibaculum cambriense]MBS5944869.1 hypothetical protein [Varibaculum cambriense]